MTSHQSRPNQSRRSKPIEGVGNLEVQRLAFRQHPSRGSPASLMSQMISGPDHIKQMRSGKSEQRAQMNADGPLSFGGIRARAVAECGTSVEAAAVPTAPVRLRRGTSCGGGGGVSIAQSAELFLFVEADSAGCHAKISLLRFELVRIFLFVSCLAVSISLQAARLPESLVFVGPGKYQTLVERGLAGNWGALPVGERTTKIGLALVGTPYRNYTLELDDRIEAPSVNMAGMDCWTFFEIALGTARAFKTSVNPTPEDLLRMIELDRYRGGHCNGVFTSRLHYLEQWLYDNQSRGLVRNVTPSLPGARKLKRNHERDVGGVAQQQTTAGKSRTRPGTRSHRETTLEAGNLVRPEEQSPRRGEVSAQRRHRLHRHDLAQRIHLPRRNRLPRRERHPASRACLEECGRSDHRLTSEHLSTALQLTRRNHGRSAKRRH